MAWWLCLVATSTTGWSCTSRTLAQYEPRKFQLMDPYKWKMNRRSWMPGHQAFTSLSLACSSTFLYLSQERMDVGFVTKELASKMAKPATAALARLKKLLGYLKATADSACKLTIPEPGGGLVVHSNHDDSDWSGNKVHRRSTLSAVHVLNGNVLFTTSRTQRVISLAQVPKQSYIHWFPRQLMESTFGSA